MSRPSKGPRIGSAAGSPYFYLYWTEEGRQRRVSTGSEDLQEAQRQLAELTLRLTAGINSSGPKPPERFSIAKALEIYLQERAAVLRSAWLQAASAEKLIKFFGEAAVDHVTKASINRYIQTRRHAPGLKGRSTVSDSTIRRELAVLQAALNHCVKEGILLRAPYVHLPKQAPGREIWLDHTEAAVLLSCMGNLHLRLFTEIALNTGARKSAVLELQWSQIDFLSGLIYLNPAGRIQTSKRRATVPLTDELRISLEAARQRASCEHVIEYQGRPIREIKVGFNAAVKRASETLRSWAENAPNEQDRSKLRFSADKMLHVTPHVLRHTAGAWMAQAGVPLGLVANVLGHTETKTTALYAHMQPDYLRPAVGAITDRLGAGMRFLQVAGNSRNFAQMSVNERQQTDKNANEINVAISEA